MVIDILIREKIKINDKKKHTNNIDELPEWLIKQEIQEMDEQNKSSKKLSMVIGLGLAGAYIITLKLKKYYTL